MTIQSEFKLIFMVEGLKFYRCNQCFCIVWGKDLNDHRKEMHPRRTTAEHPVTTAGIREVVRALYGGPQGPPEEITVPLNIEVDGEKVTIGSAQILPDGTASMFIHGGTAEGRAILDIIRGDGPYTISTPEGQ